MEGARGRRAGSKGCAGIVQKGQMGSGQMGTPKCAIFDAIFAMVGVLLALLVRRQVCTSTVSVVCVDVCYKAKTLNDCIAISQLHCNFAIFQKLQRNFRILHVKLHFFVSPFVPSPFGSPQHWLILQCLHHHPCPRSEQPEKPVMVMALTASV